MSRLGLGLGACTTDLAGEHEIALAALADACVTVAHAGAGSGGVAAALRLTSRVTVV